MDHDRSWSCLDQCVGTHSAAYSIPQHHRSTLMNRNRRLTATLLATAALAAPSALASTAEARPDTPAKTVKAQSKQLLKDIAGKDKRLARSEEHTSELQSLMRISYAVFCLKKKNNTTTH